MTEAVSRDKTLTGDTVRVFGANMFSSHGPGKAGSVMVLHGVSRQHVCAWARPTVAKKRTKVGASIVVSNYRSQCRDSRRLDFCYLPEGPFQLNFVEDMRGPPLRCTLSRDSIVGVMAAKFKYFPTSLHIRMRRSGRFAAV